MCRDYVSIIIIHVAFFVCNEDRLIGLCFSFSFSILKSSEDD